jgi:hypothetical protein
MAFDVEAAKKEGYTDKDIADYLAKQKGFNVEGARKEGYSDADIVSHLTGTTPTPQEPVNETRAETERLLAQPVPEQPQASPSVMEQMFGLGSPTARVVKGAVVDPLLAINQMASRLFPKIIQEKADQLINKYEQATNEARGSTSFDPYQLAGGVLSPAAKLALGTKGVGAGRYAKGAAEGFIAGMALTPAQVQEDDYVTQKLIQGGLGAILGGGIPMTIDAAKMGINIVKSLPISEAAKERALQKYFANLIDRPGRPIDESRAAVTGALQGAEQLPPLVPGTRLTAAQALAETPEGAKIIREQQRVEALDPATFKALELQNQQARQQALTNVFGTEADLAAAKVARTAETAPLREDALRQADVYGNVAPQLEADIAAREAAAAANQNMMGRAMGRQLEGEAVNRRGRPGWLSAATNALEFKRAAKELGSAVEQRKAESAFKQMQLKSVRDEGFYPLESSSIINRIDKMLTTPGTQSNSLLRSSLTSLKDKLVAYTDPDTGIIKSDDLYNLRHEVTDDIKKFLSDISNASFGTSATIAETTVKRMLDDAIEKASGTGMWKEYLKKFAEHSQKIDRMKVGQALKDKLGEGSLGDTEKAGSFVSAINNAVQTIKRETGVTRYNKMEEFLTPEQISAVNRVRADLNRSQKATELARGVQQSDEVAFEGTKKLPAFISTTMSVIRSTLASLARGSQAEFNSKISQLMADPQKLALFIESLPPKQMDKFAEALLAKMNAQNRNAFIELIRPTQESITRGAASEVLRRAGTPYRGGMSQEEMQQEYRQRYAQ